MEVISKTNKLKAVMRKANTGGLKIGFVPTMGSLHEGHFSLVRRARGLSDIVVVSIFVNPTQFGPGEDFSEYPRNLSHDVEMLTRLDVDYVFAPGPEEIYPAGFSTFIEVDELSQPLCGRSRPEHFRGVATVVAKLFCIVQPSLAFFGQKDAQQAILIRKLTEDLDFHVDIHICPIVREVDGLAMSSRNSYLSQAERADACVLYKCICRAARLILEGERRADRLKQAIAEIITGAVSAKVDYIEIVETQHLRTVTELSGEILIALAVYVGKTRLIDNLLVSTA